jgi:hypothetical protein
MPYRALDADQIERTIGRLVRRVEQRFAGSGLAAVVRELEGIAHRTSETAAWISRPLVWLRVAIGLLVLLIVAGLGVSLGTLQVRVGPPTLPELVQGIEATINDVVYVAIAVFFLVTIEIRVKRRRALRAIHELRAIAHVIDMHQLTVLYAVPPAEPPERAASVSAAAGPPAASVASPPPAPPPAPLAPVPGRS